VDAHEEYSPPAKTAEKREPLQQVIEPVDRISGNDEIKKNTTNFLLRGTELFTQNGRSHFGKQHN
jgi:hypothetical protein